jgi:hypothetical protein
MTRSLFVTGIVLAFLYMVGSIFLVIYIGDMRHSYYTTYDYSYDNDTSRPYVSLTRIIGGLTSLAFFFYVFIYIYGMVKVKHPTAMVMGILGLVFTAIAMMFDLFMIVDARHTTFDEIGPVFTIWSFFMLAFTIPCAILSGTKQMEEYKRKKEMQKMMFSNPYYWQNQNQNPYFNQQQQQYNQQNFQQQFSNPNPDFSQQQNQQQQQQNPQQQQNLNPYQYFNPYNPPQNNPQTPPPPPENKG